ncbi:MAG: hypothetical protein GX591_13220 [Planctomycetes bacterium]|nr:hypothetical protein [Planctomycetota bacterium]
MIPLTCDQCGERFEVPESLGGWTEACPACQHVLQVPPAATPVAYAPPRSPQARSAAWRRGSAAARVPPPTSAEKLNVAAAILVVLAVISMMVGCAAMASPDPGIALSFGFGAGLSLLVTAAALHGLAQLVRYAYAVAVAASRVPPSLTEKPPSTAP